MKVLLIKIGAWLMLLTPACYGYSADMFEESEGELVVGFKAPAPGTKVHGEVEIEVEMEAVGTAELFIRGTSMGVVEQVPMMWTWDTTLGVDGPAVLLVRARSEEGEEGEAEIEVEVENEAGAEPGALTVHVLQPLAGAEVTGTTLVRAEVESLEPVAAVEVFVATTKIGEMVLEGTEYIFDWNTTAGSNGSHSLRIEARDHANHVGEKAVTCTVNNASMADSAPPSVTFNEPLNNAVLQGLVTIRIDATDNVGVDRVELSLTGEPLGEAVLGVGGWFTYDWDTATAVPGSHTLQARVSDVAGNISESQISVEIND